MRGKWIWLGYLVSAVFLINTGISAFSTAWSWTSTQLLFVILGIGLTFVVGSWAVIWLRGGTAALKAQWALRQERIKTPLSRKTFVWSLLFWILVAVALVIYFNMTQA
jgi:hypothetical protein